MPKRRFITCPFCGAPDQPATQEHVWAQWLHASPAGQSLLAEAHGERIANQHVFLSNDTDGKLLADSREVGPIAKYLPHVKVPVCSSCNSGWMSRLENAAKNCLGPYVYAKVETLTLTKDNLRDLSSWAAKTFLAYYLTRSTIENPFDAGDYQAMASTGLPPQECAIWMMSCHHPAANVGMGVYSTFFSNPSAPIADTSTPDNYCLAYLAVGCVVFVLIRWPEDMPIELRNMTTPPQLRRFGTRQIWPNQRAQFFPLEEFPWDEFELFLDYPKSLAQKLALPALGLTEAERHEVYTDFINGASPEELASRWSHRTPG